MVDLKMTEDEAKKKAEEAPIAVPSSVLDTPPNDPVPMPAALSRREEFNVDIPASLHADDEEMPAVNLPNVGSALPSVSSLDEVKVEASASDEATQDEQQNAVIPASKMVGSPSALPSPDQIKTMRPSRYEVRRKQSDSTQN
jgi:hypothetical protein